MISLGLIALLLGGLLALSVLLLFLWMGSVWDRVETERD